MDGCAGLSDQELADGIVTWAARVAAGEARLLVLLGEFDRREAWGGAGLLGEGAVAFSIGTGVLVGEQLAVTVGGPLRRTRQVCPGRCPCRCPCRCVRGGRH